MAEQIAVALGETVTVFPSPPLTLNPPAVVIGRAESVTYNTEAIGRDLSTLPVICLGPYVGNDGSVDALKGAVRDALETDRTFGGTVADGYVSEERNWRALTIAGVDLLAVDLIVLIRS